MADPPAPAMSSAVATGACSRTTASTMAAPSWDWAPICWRSEPDLERDDHAERDGEQDQRQRGHPGQEPALVEELRDRDALERGLAQRLEAPWRTCCRSRGRRWRSSRRRLSGRLGRGSDPGGAGRPLGVPRRRAISARLRGSVVSGRLLGHDARPVTRLCQRRPPFRGLLMARGRARCPLPRPLLHREKRQARVEPCGTPCLASAGVAYPSTGVPRTVRCETCARTVPGSDGAQLRKSEPQFPNVRCRNINVVARNSNPRS